MNSAGFSLVETLIAMALTMTVTGTAVSLVLPASRTSMTQPEIMDVQQRARVAAEMISRDLAPAGAGIYAGPWRGVLPTAIPAVLPRRLGGDNGDSPDVARDTAITILSVPSTAAQTTTAAAISAASLSLVTTAAPNCGVPVLCGLTAGQDVLVTDRAGQFDVFRITAINGVTGTLRHHGQDLAAVYPAGSTVSLVTSRTYELNAPTGILRQYDGDRSDQPAADGISKLSFTYFAARTDGVAGLAEVPLSQLNDGPWIGIGTSRFDADLLRVRMIRVNAGAQAADVRMRDRVPAFEVHVDVAPRSMSVGR